MTAAPTARPPALQASTVAQEVRAAIYSLPLLVLSGIVLLLWPFASLTKGDFSGISLLLLLILCTVVLFGAATFWVARNYQRKHTLAEKALSLTLLTVSAFLALHLTFRPSRSGTYKSVLAPVSNRLRSLCWLARTIARRDPQQISLAPLPVHQFCTRRSSLCNRNSPTQRDWQPPHSLQPRARPSNLSPAPRLPSLPASALTLHRLPNDDDRRIPPNQHTIET